MEDRRALEETTAHISTPMATPRVPSTLVTPRVGDFQGLSKPRYELTLQPEERYITVVIFLPLVQVPDDISLEVAEQSLTCGVHNCYGPLCMHLPVPVDQSSVCAQFCEDKKSLTIRMAMALNCKC